jgi:hypothetical protein
VYIDDDAGAGEGRLSRTADVEELGAGLREALRGRGEGLDCVSSAETSLPRPIWLAREDARVEGDLVVVVGAERWPDEED